MKISRKISRMAAARTRAKMIDLAYEAYTKVNREADAIYQRKLQVPYNVFCGELNLHRNKEGAELNKARKTWEAARAVLEKEKQELINRGGAELEEAIAAAYKAEEDAGEQPTDDEIQKLIDEDEKQNYPEQYAARMAQEKATADDQARRKAECEAFKAGKK